MRASALGVACAVVLATLLTGCSSDTSITPPSAVATDSNARISQAQSTVLALQAALRDHDVAAAQRLGSGSTNGVLAAAVQNVAALGLSDIAMRFVDDTAIGPDDLARFGPAAWRGTVEVTYRLSAWETSSTRVQTPVIFVPDTGGQRIVAIGGSDGRTPLWLRGPVQVRSAGRALVLVRAGSAARYVDMARQALRDVGRVLPSWKGRLVLEVPGSEQELDEALNAAQTQYSNIAAVTAAVDGSLAPGSPVHVFLNPRVFDALGPRGSQVVVSHESTHVATGATFSTMPTWLLEGFADYVALAHAGIPVRTAASQILARIRQHGAPHQLPTTAELDPTATGLGATYEEAWLANRFISELHGEAKLVAFYRAVNGGTDVPTAFRQVLGTTEAAFVRRWRADLTALAGGQPG